MGRSAKAVLALIMIVACVATLVAWVADRPDATTWGLRIGSPTVALLALGAIFTLNNRRDSAPDYLRERAGYYFNRGGFCFAFEPRASDGIAYLDAYFQNQRDEPCLGRIALRPARGFFMGRAKIETILYEIKCEPAAFGVARMVLPIPEHLQGKRQSFEVGASADYFQGKGRRLRFHDGLFLRTNSNFGNAFGKTLVVAGLASGSIVLSKPATVTIDLPIGVSEAMPAQVLPQIETFWKLGDPPLDDRA